MRIVLKSKICPKCSNSFQPRQANSKWCDSCKSCQDCGKSLYNPNTSIYCRKCKSRRGIRSSKQIDQLNRLHQNMWGDNNPAKSPEVGRKISQALRRPGVHAVNNDPELFRRIGRQNCRHITKRKVSKLEIEVGLNLDSVWEPQYKVAWYTLDFAYSDIKVALEVQGCYFHGCLKCFPDSPSSFIQRQTMGNDKRKRKYLTKKGWRIIELWEHDFNQEGSESIHRLIGGIDVHNY